MSQKIGKGIAENQRAYITLLNRYFDQKKNLIDVAVKERYLPSLISNIVVGLEAEGEKLDFSDSEKVSDIVGAVIQKRDEMQADLEKARIMLIERIDADHNLLLQANTNLTSLLKSAVEVKKATASLAETLAKPISSKFDFLEFESFLDEYLFEAGDTSTKIGKIHEVMKSLLKKGGK